MLRSCSGSTRRHFCSYPCGFHAGSPQGAGVPVRRGSGVIAGLLAQRPPVMTVDVALTAQPAQFLLPEGFPVSVGPDGALNRHLVLCPYLAFKLKRKGLEGHGCVLERRSYSHQAAWTFPNIVEFCASG